MKNLDRVLITQLDNEVTMEKLYKDDEYAQKKRKEVERRLISELEKTNIDKSSLWYAISMDWIK